MQKVHGESDRNEATFSGETVRIKEMKDIHPQELEKISGSAFDIPCEGCTCELAKQKRPTCFIGWVKSTCLDLDLGKHWSQRVLNRLIRALEKMKGNPIDQRIVVNEVLTAIERMIKDEAER